MKIERKNKMNELQNVDGFNAKIYGTVENPLFLAKDIAELIEHSRASEMLKTVDDDEKLMQTILASGQKRNMWFLTEDGLYEVLMSSKKPQAKVFKKKVKEILKTIRKDGFYMTEAKVSQVRIPTSQRELVQLALSANEETNQRVDEIDDRLTDIEMNKLITTEDKGTIDAHVRKKVHSICKDFKLEQKAKSMLFQELGSSIKKLFNVPNRGRLKDKDFISALEFIDSWQPSSVTKAQIKQLDLF